jgi:hypothetical protein
MKDEEKQALIQEGRNQVLYIMLAIGDENVAHDNFHPDKAHFLFETRREIVQRLKRGTPDGVTTMPFPREWPDFEKYTYCPG